MHGEPAMGPDFQHFPFANPDAPQGGTLSRGLVGNFDSMNPFIVLGQAAAGLTEYHFPALMYRSWDEPFTMYGYVAEGIEVPEDRSWVTFHLNPDARWHDGTPITADDVIFSLETHRTDGIPARRRNYNRVETIDRIDDHTVRFELDDQADRETPLILALMPLISEAYYEDVAFDRTTMDVPLGGGPYQLTGSSAGRSVTYDRVDDWWGDDLPQFAGQFNFDRLRYEYFRDGTIGMEAFRAGEYNYRFETSADQWATGYDFPAARDGRITLLEAPHSRPAGMRAFAFNTRKNMFDDPRVREALAHAFDFEWVNRNYLRGLYNRTTSFFANSELAHTETLSEREEALLDPYRDQLPERVFAGAYEPPSSDGSGNIRGNLRTALSLLSEAGWEVRDGVLTHTESGQPMTFEILLRSASDERIALSFTNNLRRLGIEASVRTVDSSQYVARTEQYDFDMIIHHWGASLSPGAEQDLYWGSGSAEIEGTRNYPGVQDPVVDALIVEIADAIDREDLVAATRALDRVLLSGHYVIPLYYQDTDTIAYWEPMDHVDYQPMYGQLATVNAWWSPDQ